MGKTLKIVLIGPQGSGKGTQAEMLAKKYNISVLSTGDIFRREIKNQTELGKLADSLINKGQLVPNEITNKIVLGELAREKYKNGFILDGYPRNMAQAEALDGMVGLTQVIELALSDDEVIERLGGRRVCSECGDIYHIQNKPPKQEGVCDVCGGRLIVRDDDKPEAIKKRLEIYHQETEPILNFYANHNKLIRINGKQPIEKVFEDIVGMLEE